MKQLKRLLLFLSCVFLLPTLQGESPFTSSDSQTVLRPTAGSHVHTTGSNLVKRQAAIYSLNDTIRKYRTRTKALNDFHELCLFVASIRIKTVLLYIQPQYKGYKESYISVAVTISDWRGPPVA
ncbi:hypothetical protein [Chitinophaga rhizophila]|uniref:Uncharacterized protein n=1 Tax=Chitinophaga rhizophila TaxID=2866212 RepID=A0ABS7GI99_9BACT|nr:hypothetical protein [Chitinophaga rhizophila]MBW8686870.1 hypothetical protein [Chitinophaga rhizophila]